MADKYAELPDTWIKSLLVALDGTESPDGKEPEKPKKEANPSVADTWLDVLLRNFGDSAKQPKQRDVYRDITKERKSSGSK